MKSLTPQQKKHLSELPEKLDAYQTPPEEQPNRTQKTPASERARQILVERIIQEAIENGQFDDLPGQGKPLPLNKNPYLEPGQDLAFDLLKRNGFAPEWIERDKEIRRNLAQARHKIQLAWQQRQGNPAAEPKWRAAVTRFETELAKLNRKIDELNLMVPAVSLQRPRLQLANELHRVRENINS